MVQWSLTTNSHWYKVTHERFACWYTTAPLYHKRLVFSPKEYCQTIWVDLTLIYTCHKPMLNNMDVGINQAKSLRHSPSTLTWIPKQPKHFGTIQRNHHTISVLYWVQRLTAWSWFCTHRTRMSRWRGRMGQFSKHLRIVVVDDGKLWLNDACTNDSCMMINWG